MRTQYNVRADHLTHDEIIELDKDFTNAGWILVDSNRKLGTHTLRVYQWEQDDVEPIYPVGFQRRTESKDRIDMNKIYYPVDD